MIALRRTLHCAGMLAMIVSAATADGGRLRVHRSFDDGALAAFTAPEPARVGVVDVSVWVQDAAGGTVADARVRVRLTPRGQPDQAIEAEATREAATNKLFQAALVELPEPGAWDVAVTCETGSQPPRVVEFALEVAPPLPALRGAWLWFSWPALGVALFAVHRRLVARSARATGECRTARGPCG